MKMFLPLLALLIAATCLASDDFRSQARAAEGTRQFAAAVGLYEKAAVAAITSGDARNAFHDLHMAGGIALQIGESERVVAISRQAIAIADEILPKLKGVEREAVHYCRIECRGNLDRALSFLGRIAEGYAELRKIWRDIEEYRIAEEQGAAGDPRLAADLAGWSPKLRSLVWRATTREADYLDIMGRTNEAAAILRRASTRITVLGPMAAEENFYAAKVRPALALMVDFLGYRREAMAILRTAIADQTVRLTGSSLWGARINLLRKTSQYDGPSRELLNEAEECHRQMVLLSPTGRSAVTAGLVEKMRADYDANYDAAGKLRHLAGELRGSGMIFEGMYAERDALIANADKPGLDGEFVRLLNEMRQRGSKRGEPTLYREYAAYLLRTGRPAEALPLFREALRLTESFGWVLHAPILRLYIISTLCELRDFASAEAEWNALDRQLATIADLPAERALDVRVSRIKWLALRGEAEKARAALDEARAFADAQKLSAWIRRSLDGISLDAAVTVAAAPAVATVRTPVSLQPAQVATSAAPGDPLRARFALRNSDRRARTGEFRARGPAIQISLANAPRQITGSAAAGGAENELRFPLVLAPGEDLSVVLEMKNSPVEGMPSSWQIAWHEGGDTAESEWRIATEPDPFVVSVINANRIRLNAFHAISFTHQIVRRDGAPAVTNIRFVASTPLRLEYYDAVTQRLLAVDASGNGTFTDPGDVLVDDADLNLAPDVKFDGRERLREIEVLVFATTTAPAEGRQHIMAELLIGDRWQPVARNELE